MQVSGATPGLCGSIAAGMKWSGNSRLDAVAQLVADRGPGRRHLEVADVVGHEARARAEDRQVASRARFISASWLVSIVSRSSSSLIVSSATRGLADGSVDAGDLPVAPGLQRLGRGRVVAVEVDDHARRASVVAEVERQADVVLGDGARGVLRVEQVVELGVLQLRADRAVVGKAVHERREPPREALGPPDAAQAALRVGVEAGVAAVLVVLDQRAATGTSRRSRPGSGPWRRWAARCGPASPARNIRPKRSGSATKLRSGAMLFSSDGPVTSASRPWSSRRSRSSSPERVVGPVLDLVGQRHLQVVAAAGRGCASSTARSRAGC